MDEFRLLPVFALRNQRPELVIMEMGTNDIANAFAVIVETLIDIGLILLEEYNVKHVILYSCLKREKNLHTLSSSQFEDLVYSLNTELASKFGKF